MLLLPELTVNHVIDVYTWCQISLTLGKHATVYSISLWRKEYFITLTSLWTRWHLKSTASRVFTQAFVQAQMKVNIKAPRHWPLWGRGGGGGGEFTGEQCIPRTKDRLRGNASIWWRHHVVVFRSHLRFIQCTWLIGDQCYYPRMIACCCQVWVTPYMECSQQSNPNKDTTRPFSVEIFLKYIQNANDEIM